MIYWLAGPAEVRPQVGIPQPDDKNNGIGHHLYHIIHLHDPLELERIPVLHPFGTVVENEGQVDTYDGQDYPNVAEQRQVGHPGIPIFRIEIPHQAIQITD